MGAYVDFIGTLDWVNSYGKKQCKSLFWRAKAALKKTVKNHKRKQQCIFQYDPSSYALNFDDGCCRSDTGLEANMIGLNQFRDCSQCKNIMCVYHVPRVKS
ncbi:hypothetical protein ERO13_D09G071200v2 [Gossypium hirsutum]|uniref:Uncharacterized protein n=2 Tax=Gossypium TaxID=3633 RepID=A0A0D2SU24_GOSRA|nr:hypothetical protein ERO13_D09G071200v2 [Gossypium hirsutum]KJB34820.1 hypothetical protein B456_006G086100 [Gossypium raimondii]MBA0587456.1 hypothetical protein [Gossypium raimondii]TYI64420.1 hypothetical protein E1A91_D09G087200v1 [Gossypium mustelinum]